MLPSARAQKWSDFQWVPTKVGAKTLDRAALVLPVRLAGLPGLYHMQLDTGADVTMLYGVPYRDLLQRHGKAAPPPGDHDRTPVQLNGTVGAYRTRRFPVLIREKHGKVFDAAEKIRIVGTLGLDFFAKRKLLLDYPNARFAIVEERARIPQPIGRRARFFPVAVRDKKLFIPVEVGGKPLADVFFDTGASLFPLSVDKPLWEEMTGRKGDEPDNDRIEGKSWGNPIVFLGALTKEPLRIGPLDVGRVMVYHKHVGPKELDFASWSFKATGLVGNAPFYDSFMIVLDLPNRRMGLMRSDPLRKRGGLLRTAFVEPWRALAAVTPSGAALVVNRGPCTGAEVQFP